MTRTAPSGLRRLLTAALAVATAGVMLAPAATASRPPDPIELQILSVSDWHAQLDPISSGGQQVGGAAVLSTYFQQERAANPRTLTLTAGDAFGASPPLSAFFEEEPAVRAMNLMGFDADTLGNHNFDRGVDHLQRMVDLADFQYVSANLLNLDDNLQGVEDFTIFDLDGVKVAVIGITNPEAPTLVFPGSFGTIEVTDPVVAANKARAAAQRAGAKVFVAITHMGITGFDPATGDAFGPLVDFADSVGGYDLIVGDHTDFQYEGVHGRALVVENRSKGATYARTTLSVNPRSGRVASSSVEFVTPTVAGVTPDPAVVAMLDEYRAELGPIFNTKLGDSDRAIPRSDSCGRGDGRLCESLVGNVVTDALRARYGTDVAITNAGGLRANLTCPTTDNPADFCAPFTPPPYPITRGQVLSVLPFGNIAVTGTVTGAQLKQMLENGVSAMPGANGRFAQVSGLCFTYDVAAPAGSRVVGAVRQAADGSCTGAPMDLTAASTYSLAQNDFMASGGDGYPNLIGNFTSREILDQVLADHVTAAGVLTPRIQGRITCTSSGSAVCPTVVAP
ncbi:bifunctional UDP-sugar hydrolase/5'-nucleotidase [Actinotalea sp. Marseille-Q4924]|uniref:bifunctional metallophosphatase/5'-nucleotidase n=1 Tax=Actinotalea sp. Marseille-Q4924 TaxID=2866571 RepID=UPI001CE3F0DB|nr:5'-nucleotidase C-terminal domain-containing protein [Actinotalea sp. Marseille-Q4924]